MDTFQAGSLVHALVRRSECHAHLVISPNGEASRTESYDIVSNQSSKAEGTLQKFVA